jgi:hypothetical protein
MLKSLGSQVHNILFNNNQQNVWLNQKVWSNKNFGRTKIFVEPKVWSTQSLVEKRFGRLKVWSKKGLVEQKSLVYPKFGLTKGLVKLKVLSNKMFCRTKSCDGSNTTEYPSLSITRELVRRHCSDLCSHFVGIEF